MNNFFLLILIGNMKKHANKNPTSGDYWSTIHCVP